MVLVLMDQVVANKTSAIAPSIETAKRFVEAVPKKAKRLFSGEVARDKEKKRLLSPKGITGVRG